MRILLHPIVDSTIDFVDLFFLANGNWGNKSTLTQVVVG